MTQEVQPLTWQKRTNIEEHQQFFSKINEIIGNLAPTVDEAEQAIAQANAAIASANDAASTANAASAAASAAASQAQTAANTVAGYDTRLTAAEGDIDSLQAADQTMAGDITALGTRMTAAESKNSQQDTAIGVLQTADGQNVKISRINEYAVGLTGNQSITGEKSFNNRLIRTGGHNSQGLMLKNSAIPTSTTAVTTQTWSIPISVTADDGSILGYIAVGRRTDGKSYGELKLNDVNGNAKTFILGIND